ncbi:hypothetical protein N7535_000719 [Penicillium sp. DV-2018c]|nr:hypothetical protein N7461_006029 [Penicillium sp. DV-2018c]KAJ5582099.1 hypothetical protein N7535_000719 [Penicillium sp. DV-2018c]
MSVVLENEERPRFVRLGPTWYHELPYLPYGWEALNDRGSGTLKHAAMKEVLRDQSLLRPELFEHVINRNPNLSAGLFSDLIIYKLRSNKQTMHLWKLMHAVYPEQFRELSPHYCLHAGSPRQPLTQYMDILNSDDFRWRAVLAIETNYCSATDIASIPKIKNLVALDICTRPYRPYHDFADEGQPLEDGFVRGWIESNALQHLRVLRFRDQDRVTTATLRALRRLPELQLIVAYDCYNFEMNLHTEKGWPKNDPFRVEGWSASRLIWFRPPKPRDPSDKPLDDHLLDVLHVYQTSLLRPENKPSSLDTKLPILEINLRTIDSWEKERGILRSCHWKKSTLLFTRSPMELERDIKSMQCEKTKRRKPQEPSGRPAKRAVMKERGPVDISKTLNEFF